MKFGSSKARAAFFAAATVLSNISSVSGHGIEVRSCLTPDGKLRFFVETWHEGVPNPSDFGTMTMDIEVETNGVWGTPSSATELPDAVISGQNPYHPDRFTGNDNQWLDDNVWGCLNGALPELVTKPIQPGKNNTYSSSNVYDKYSWYTPLDSVNAVDTYSSDKSQQSILAYPADRVGGPHPYAHTCHHWVNSATMNWAVYERQAQCNVNIKFTLLQGNSVVLDDGCGGGDYYYYYYYGSSDQSDPEPFGALYPAIIGPTNFTDSASPVPKVDGNTLPYTIEVEAASPGGETVSYAISAGDDCDASPTVVVHQGLASGSTFPVGDTAVTIRATDNQNNIGDGILTVRVTPSPSTSPSAKPTGSPSTSPSASPSASPSTSPSAKPVTGSPSTSPSASPSATPTAKPSDVPSLAPSSVEQTITLPGQLSFNQDICSLDTAAQETFVSNTLQTIQEVADCFPSEGCYAAITDVCGSGQRRLQSSGSWQLGYTLTETYTCEFADCSSPADNALADAVVSGITNSITTSLGSAQFLTVLSQNIRNSPGTLDTTILLCLAVWGNMNQPVSAVLPRAGQLFYPDWKFNSGTCLSDGNQPPYMKINNPDGYLHESLEECCEAWYGGWNKNKCLNLQGSGRWFVDHMSHKCVTDCTVGKSPTCGGLANSVSDNLYDTPLECCQNQLFWQLDKFCEASSLNSSCYGGTGKYYRGDTAGVDVCVRDCSTDTADQSCGGIVEDNSVPLYESPEDCCTQQYGWIENDLCVMRTTLTTATKYWPDKIKGKCVDDSVTPTEDLSVTIYDTISDCCTNEIHWLSEISCTVASDSTAAAYAGTGKYYINWSDEQCVKDCVTGAGCGGLAPDYMDETNYMFDSASACCSLMSWNDISECIRIATT